MTNRERFINALNGENREDDCGASDENWIFYHVDCPYVSGDARGECHDDIMHKAGIFDICSECKFKWLDAEEDME